MRTGAPAKISGKVVVIGGNTAALDAARTALRLGATEVTVVTRHDAATIPAGSHDLAAASEEGVRFEFGVEGPGLADAAGKGATVIVSEEAPADDKTEAGRPKANKYTGRTPTEGVFAAGDAVAGTKSAIHALAAGKRTALAADAWLRGQDSCSALGFDCGPSGNSGKGSVHRAT